MKIVNMLLISTLSVLTLTAYAKTNSTHNATSTPSSAPDISGNYQCQGYDPFGKSNYSNPVTITKRGSTFNFQWLNQKGYPFLLGTGVMHPDIGNMVSVVFWDPKKAEYFGTEVFAIKSDGSMSATWTVQGEDQVGTETCTKKT